eukprot:TRINITY_DN37958_c0_g1_i1.p1 TRINITY_DN37958_c0_g1~~TRINITY_DN37958_c0_g1_i1.p1  ORF type:complete len:283 (+),score=41.65 TRINITY_DN37958_c0_g1_i1:53-901(+)
MDILVSEISAKLHERAVRRVSEPDVEDASSKYLASEFVLSQATKAAECSDLATDVVSCEELRISLENRCKGHSSHLRLLQEARNILSQRYSNDYNDLTTQVSESIRPSLKDNLEQALQRCHDCTADESLMVEVNALQNRKYELKQSSDDITRDLESLQSEINNRIKDNAITMCNILSRYRIPSESMDKSYSDYLLALVEALQRKIHVLTADIGLTVYNEKTIPALRHLRDTISDLTNSTLLEQRALEALVEQYEEIDDDPEYHILDEQYRRLERVRSNLEGP